MAESAPAQPPAPSESMFGKIRGRFDEAAAQAQDRTLVDSAMAAICAMPPDEFLRFQTVYRRVFWRGPALPPVCEEKA